MTEEKWGVGNAKNEKAFDTVKVGEVEMELFHGEHPHSRQDNCTYARSKDGDIWEFSGHRMLFKIEIEEGNYFKHSELSGDEIRKSCHGKLYVNGMLCFSCGGRTYENCFRNIENFISSMELHWNWYPKHVDKEIGRVIGYKEQLFKIDSFILGQGCMMLKTLDGKPRKKFLWEDEEGYEMDEKDYVKIEINSEDITWFPKTKTT